VFVYDYALSGPSVPVDERKPGTRHRGAVERTSTAMSWPTAYTELNDDCHAGGDVPAARWPGWPEDESMAKMDETSCGPCGHGIQSGPDGPGVGLDQPCHAV